MFINEKWSIGNIIKQEREKRGATQKQLCRGLCSISTLNRIENDERDMDMFLQLRIFQRLGYSPNKFELYGSCEEQEQYNQRLLIEKYMRQNNLAEMKKELCSYRGKWRKWVETEPLHKQFVLGMENYLEVKEGNVAKGIDGLMAAIEITVPDLKDELYRKTLIGEDELALFDSLACAYDLKGDRYKAFRIRENIIDYLERNQPRADQMVRLYAKIICGMAPVMLEMEKATECLERCNHAIEILSSQGRLFHLQDLLYWKAQSIEKLYVQGDIERQAVIEVFQRAYFMYDLIGDEKMADTVWNYLSEVYEWECIR